MQSQLIKSFLLVSLLFLCLSCSKNAYLVQSSGWVMQRTASISKTDSLPTPTYQQLQVATATNQITPTGKPLPPSLKLHKQKNFAAPTAIAPEQAKTAVIFQQSNVKTNVPLAKADPDYLVMFLIFMLLVFAILAAFTGIILGLIWLLKSLGELAFMAALFNAILIAIKAGALTERRNVESNSRDSIGFLVFSFYFLEIVLGIAALALLISLLSGWPFFWTAMALIPLVLLIWGVGREIREGARRRREKRNSPAGE